MAIDTIGLDFTDYLRLRDLGDGVIHFDGDIDDGDTAWLRLQMNEALRLGHDRLTLHLTSPGGQVYAALALHDDIVHARDVGREITIVVGGYAASAASMIVLQAATTRVARPSARFLVHEPRKFASMDAMRTSDVEDELSEMRALGTQIAELMAARMGKSVSDVEAIFKRREVWFSAAEALAAGLIDEIRT